MSFHNEIKISYETLNEIVSGLKKYESALISMEKSIANMDKVISENEGRTFDALRKVKYDDIKGLTPKQIRDKFALTNTPTHMVDVNVPKGTRLRTGTVNPIEGWGNGGGQQFDFMNERLSLRYFVNERTIE